MATKKKNLVKKQNEENDAFGAFRLLALIREAVGDPYGRLMQDELIEHCRKLYHIASTKTSNRIRLEDMEDGDVAIIRKWGKSNSYLGRVVQRYGDDLVTIGRSSDHGFTKIFKYGGSLNKDDYLLEPIYANIKQDYE